MKNFFTIRSAATADLPALLTLEQQVFSGDRLSKQQYRRHIANNSAVVLVVIRNKMLMGNTVVFFRKNSSIARLYSIAVSQTAQGAGIGTTLLHAVENIARERSCTRLRLEVRQDNWAAIRLYEREGFQLFGHYENYYEDGANAWRYEKYLNK